MPRPLAARLHGFFTTLTVAVFLVAIWVPFLGFLLGWPAPWIEENRPRAPYPTLEATRESIVSYPARAAAAFGDRFGFRDHLIRWNNAVTLLWLRDSMTLQGPNPMATDFWQATGEQPRRLVNGGGRWFFHFSPRMMANQRGLVPLDAPAVGAWVRELERRRAWLAERGIAFLFVIAPEKQSIYPERLPPGVPRRHARTDTVVQLLRDTTRVDVLDLRPLLRAAKRERRTYHRTDTHWNAYGAFVAYQAIAARLTAVVPGYAALPPSEVEIGTRQTRGWELLTTLGIADLVPETVVNVTSKRPPRAREVGDVAPPGSLPELRVTETDRADLPTAVVVHDSFMEASLNRFLSEDFSRVTYVRRFREGVISREQPDVVIQEAAERHLMAAPAPALPE